MVRELGIYLRAPSSLPTQGSIVMASSAAAQVAGPSKNSQAPSSKAGAGGPLAAGKSSKAAIKVRKAASLYRSSPACRMFKRVLRCDRNQREGSAGGGKRGGAGASSSDQEGPRTPDPKTLRRLAQNREAARKSRLRKKVINCY